MEMVGVLSPCFSTRPSILPPASSFFKPGFLNPTTPVVLPSALSATPRSPIHRRGFLTPLSSIKRESEVVPQMDEDELEEPPKTLVYSLSPLPLLLLAALPRAGAVTSLFEPFVELVKSWNLPCWLVHWGHPGNMAVVLFAMGGYGTYLGFRIKYSDDAARHGGKSQCQGLASEASGWDVLLLRPWCYSPHAITGFSGLSLLTIQTILPSLFEGNPGLRNVHGILGSGIMTLFLIHAALGLQLGFSY